MRKLIYLLLLITASATAQVKVIAPVEPNSLSDTYPTHTAEYGKGGLMSVATWQLRNAIPSERRTLGMLVRVTGVDSTYTLTGGTANANWAVYGSVGISTATQTALDLKADKSITISAGTGLSGGGSLAANRTITADTTFLRTVANSRSLAQTQTALNTKQATLVSGTNIKTVNGTTLLGSGDLSTTADTTVYRTVANSRTLAQTQTALNLKANLASPALTGTPTAPTASAGTNTTQVATTAYADAKVQNSLTASTTIAPSATAVNTALATKSDNTITISAGTGLTGGGSLAANRTISADTTVLRTVANSRSLAQTQTALNLKADNSITISAGTGLSGGGSLAANRTITADTTVLRTVANSRTLAQTQTALNTKQATLSGTGIVKSTSGTISYLTDNSANWNTAYGWGNPSGVYAPLNGTGATGTWNIAVTGSSNSTLYWGNYAANFDQFVADGATTILPAFDPGSGTFKSIGQTGLRTFIGLNSAAYTASTAYATASHTHTFASLTSKPTTIGGYGITDAQSTLSGTGIVKSTSGTISYLTDNSSNWNTAYGWGNPSGVYAPLNGTGATGTWNIAINGNANSATYWGNYAANFDQFVADGATTILPAFDPGSGTFKSIGQTGMRTFLGLNSAAYTASTAYATASHSHTFASLTSKPTTIGGYGITDFNSLGDARWAPIGGTVSNATYWNDESYAYTGVLGAPVDIKYIMVEGADYDGTLRTAWTRKSPTDVKSAMGLGGTSATFGVAKIGTWTTNSSFARFGHSSYDGATNYGFLQYSDGAIYIQGNGINFQSAATFSNLGTGTVYSNSGTLTSTNPSDKRLKNTILPLAYGLKEVMKLQPKTFYYNSDSTKSNLKYGFIAQDVQPVMPDVVRKLSPDSDKLGLETDGIYVTLVKAIQEQQALIEELKKRVAALEK